MDVLNHEEQYNQKRTCERIGKVAPVTKMVTVKRINWHGYVIRRDVGHVLRTIVDASEPCKGRRRAQETRWKHSWTQLYGRRGVKGGERIGQGHWKRYVIQVMPATPDDGKNLRRRRRINLCAT